jgi:Protein of unknown function (DUF3570)
MQLETKNLKALLTTATCALLSIHSPAQATETISSDDEWQFDTALMYYGESDRVTAVEGIIAGQKLYGNDEVLNLKLTLDSLTGASANGAVAQPEIQTFTRPSGNGQYTTKPGDTPLDDTFKDTRVQFTGQWTQPISEDYTWSIGGNVSKEYDYLSLSVNSNLARDFNNKNTTLSAGFAFAFDIIEPEGGIPKPLSTMVIGEKDTPEFDDAFDATRIGSDEDKTTVDLLFGVTQVINRRMIVQLNYSYSDADGYMTDPFKIVSVVNNEGYAQKYLYEHRPDTRTKHAVYGQAKYHFEQSIMDISYRYMTDDWSIDSHTVDLHYTFLLNDGHYIEPHFRYYTQSAAEFYQPFLIENQPLPKYVSADYRIGEMDAYTLGIKYNMPINNGDNLAFRLEYYKQSPTSDGTKAIGVLKDQELYEEVDAIIAQITYSF